MSIRVGRALILFTLLLCQGPAFEHTAAARSPRRVQRTQRAQDKFAIFITSSTVGSGESQVEPVAFVDARGAFEEPLSAGAEENAISAFFKRYYRQGAKYRLIFGGAESGSVTIREAVRAECAPLAARVEVSTTAKLGGNVMALATDAPRAFRAQSSRRPPTERERAAVFRLAKSILTQKRLSAALVERQTTTLNLTATDLDGDGREELVGSYLVKSGPKMRDSLFLVAAPRGDGFGAAIQKYEHINSAGMMDPSLIGNVGEDGLLTELFVEQFDADGDGVGELFTVSRSFEGTTYRAYRRQGGVWRAAYEYYSYRCAF
jgi:hypothetical protein